MLWLMYVFELDYIVFFCSLPSSLFFSYISINDNTN